MRAAKALAAVLLLLGSQLQAETIQGALSTIIRQANTQSYPIGSIWGQAVDATDNTYQYSVRACFDDSTWNCATGNVVNMTANCNGGAAMICSAGGASTGKNHWLLQIGGLSALGGTPNVNPADGSTHLLYVTQISRLGDTQALDIHVDWAWGLPVRWDAANSNLAPTYTPDISSATPMTWASQAILVNTSDGNSTGSSTGGTLVCTTGSGVSLYDNGFAGYYIQQHGSNDCSHVYTAAMGAPATTITVANFNTAWQTILNALPSSIQYVQAAWLLPNVVVGLAGSGGCQGQGGTQPCYGMSGWITMYPQSNGVEPSATSCIQRTYRVGMASYLNSWFNSGTDATPYTTNNVRPSALLGAAKCSGCTDSLNYGSTGVLTWAADVPTFKAVVDAAKTNIGSNPFGVAQFPFILPGVHQEITLSPQQLGSALSSRINASLVGTAASPTSAAVTSGTATGNILYFNDAAQWNYNSTYSFAPGAGLFLTAASYAGQVGPAQTGQTPVVSAMQVNSTSGASCSSGNCGGVRPGKNQAVMVGGTAIEPCESINEKDLRPDLYLAYLTAGWSMGQSFWKSTKDPWITNVYGDPMAQPYQPPLPGFGGSTVSGKTTSAGKTKTN